MISFPMKLIIAPIGFKMGTMGCLLTYESSASKFFSYTSGGECLKVIPSPNINIVGNPQRLNFGAE